MPTTFDANALKEELELDDEDILELIAEFKDFLQETMEQLEAKLQLDDFTAARAFAHSVKGSAGNLRVNQVHETAKAMQFAFDNGQPEKLKELFPTLKAQADAFLEEVNHL